jgi:hypothetical protein
VEVLLSSPVLLIELTLDRQHASCRLAAAELARGQVLAGASLQNDGCGPLIIRVPQPLTTLLAGSTGSAAAAATTTTFVTVIVAAI